ncbi:hypothetical protein ACLI4Z_04585 [Natrialbaceae archaeon A-arb3/5]
MVDDRITDGKRIAQLLASELDGREDGELGTVAVTDADRDVEPTADGARAYDVRRTDTDESIARAFVHENRMRLAFSTGQETVADAAESAGLRVQSSDDGPATTDVLVESGAAVKRTTDVVEAVLESFTADA